MRERLLEDLLWFLERPSVTGEEKPLCDDLEARVSRLAGWETRRVANNLVVRRAEPDGSRARLVFAGHLDTVPEPQGGLPVRVEDGRVYGRGASDMKAGDAVMLALVEDFSWEDSWAEPLFVFYEREEGPYAENGLELVFAEVPDVLDADLALVLEPTAGALEVGCVGTAQVEVTFKGKLRPLRPAVAGGERHYGGRRVSGGDARKAGGGGRRGGTDLLRGARADAGAGRAGQERRPRRVLDQRQPPFPARQGIEDVRSVFEGLVGGDARYDIVDYAPSGPVELDNPLLRRLIEPGLEVRPKQAWTDVARFAQRGVAAANFGPGLPAQAHQEAEYAELPLLERCYERLASFLMHN